MQKTSVRQDIALFLENPNFLDFRSISTSEKMIILFKVLILTEIALFLAFVPVGFLEKLDVISKISQKSDIILNSSHPFYVNYRRYIIFSIILLVPLMEEMQFRLFLTRFRINYFILSLSLILGGYLFNLLKEILWIPKSYLFQFLIYSLYMLIISALLGGFLYLFRAKISNLEDFWNKNPGLIYYSIAICFAIAHIGNLKYEHHDLFFMPFILLPYFIYGLSFGYLRVRLGIAYSIALHFIFLAIRFGLPELLIVLKDKIA